ncbi:MAG: hypothetical protein ACK4IT_01285 [Thioalkalivibrionaceae bacterium]
MRSANGVRDAGAPLYDEVDPAALVVSLVADTAIARSLGETVVSVDVLTRVVDAKLTCEGFGGR